MKIGKSVRKSIDEMLAGDAESAMLHACNAIDGTSRKRYTELHPRTRFTKFLRENYDVLGPMAMPGFDLDAQVFPVSINSNKDGNAHPDLADIIWSVHRCCHGHGDALPAGFELVGDYQTGKKATSMLFAKGSAIRLSDRLVFGMLAAAVLAPENCGEQSPDGYYLTYGEAGDHVAQMYLKDWWGGKEHWPKILAISPVGNGFKIDFSHFHDDPVDPG